MRSYRYRYVRNAFRATEELSSGIFNVRTNTDNVEEFCMIKTKRCCIATLMTLNHLYHLMSEEIVAVLVDVDDDDETDIDAKFVCSQTPF